MLLWMCLMLVASSYLAPTRALVVRHAAAPRRTALAAKRRLFDKPKKKKKKTPAPEEAARAAAGDALALCLDVLRAIQQPAFLAHPALERIGELPELAQAAPSPVAGTGLFATRDISAGTLVAFYAVHAVGRDNHFASGEAAFIADASDEAHFDVRSADAAFAYKQYVVGGRPLFGAADDARTPYFVDVNPGRSLVEGWAASLVNDGAACEDDEEGSVAAYYEASRARKNCVLVPVGPAPLLAYATTRDVAEGDEFLTTYGADYWLPMGAPATPQVVDLARETARDIDDASRLVSEAYAKDAATLERMFVQLACGETI